MADDRAPLSPFVRGAVERMNALARGCEEMWGMTFAELANLEATDPDEAARVKARAIERAEEAERAR